MPESQPTDRYDYEERLRQDLEFARQEVAEALLGIRRKLTSPFDWRGAIRRRPLAALVGGAALGFTIALLGSAQWKDEP